MNIKKNAAFTLIELLVVVLIIGILAAMALPQYERAVLHSRYVQAQIIAKNFADAANRYYMAHGRAPDSWLSMDLSVPSGWRVSTGDPTLVYSNTSRCDLKEHQTENIVCYILGGGKHRVAYVQFFGAGGNGRQCWACTGDSVAQDLCQGEGGEEVGVYNISVCQSGRITHYTIP